MVSRFDPYKVYTSPSGATGSLPFRLRDRTKLPWLPLKEDRPVDEDLLVWKGSAP